MRSLIAVAAALLVAFPLQAAENDAAPRASAGASRPADPAQPAARSSLFGRLDRNRDGYLSRDEMESDEARKTNWIASDRDNDGRISRSEFNEISSASGRVAGAAGR